MILLIPWYFFPPASVPVVWNQLKSFIKLKSAWGFLPTPDGVSFFVSLFSKIASRPACFLENFNGFWQRTSVPASRVLQISAESFPQMALGGLGHVWGFNNCVPVYISVFETPRVLPRLLVNSLRPHGQYSLPNILSVTSSPSRTLEQFAISLPSRRILPDTQK